MNRAEQAQHYANVRRRIDTAAFKQINLPKIPPWPTEKECVLARMWMAGEKIEVIAATLGISYSSVRSKRKRMKLPGRRAQPTNFRTFSDAERTEFERMWAKGRTVKVMARRFGLTPKHVHIKRIHFKLPPRKQKKNGIEVRIDVDVEHHKILKRRSDQMGMNLTQYLNRLIKQALDNEARGKIKVVNPYGGENDGRND